MVLRLGGRRLRRWIGYARQSDAWRAAGQSVGWRVAGLAARRAGPPQTVVVWPRSPSAYALGWADPIRVGLAHHVEVVREEVAQPEGNVFAFGIRSPQGLLRAAIDFDDLSTLAGDPRNFDVYFKMQYARTGYEDERVVPGGYVSKKPALYDFVDRWRALRATSIAWSSASHWAAASSAPSWRTAFRSRS